MNTKPATQDFLGEVTLIDLGRADTILLHAPFHADRFHQDLFAAFNIPFPPKLSCAVAKRQAEFLAGRALLGRAFDRLGLPAQVIDNGPDRAPIWPVGITGSISHSDTTCACILSTNPALWIGVDIETDFTTRSDQAVRSIALQESELVLINTQSKGDYLPALIFSAKETLFKALYPTVQKFFGFDAAHISALPSQNHIPLELSKPLHPSLPAGCRFDIHYEKGVNQTLTWLITQAG